MTHVDALELELLRLLAPQQQPLMQLPCDIINRLHARMNPLRDGIPDLLDETLHLEVFEGGSDDDVREEVGGREGDEEGGGDDCEGVEEVEAVLVAGECGFAGDDELQR